MLEEFKEMSEVSNTSQKARIWSFLKTAMHFFALLAAAPLSISPQTSRGSGCILALSSLSFSHQSSSSYSHHNFLLF